jgi:hypothetical integral membrane protein (TIGR02206 family)
MEPVEFITFGKLHNLYLLGTAGIWFILPFIGAMWMNPAQRKVIAWVLCLLTVGNEIADDILRLSLGIWSASDDLPLHMCGFSIFLSAYAVVTKNQDAFELAYFWGIAGAIQAIITPDPSRWPLGHISVFWNFLSHGIIILNVLWLIIAEGMRCRISSFYSVVMITCGTAFVVSFLNKWLDANYWFLCNPPGGDSPFLMGTFPDHLLAFAGFAFIIVWLIYIPMYLIAKRNVKTKKTEVVH